MIGPLNITSAALITQFSIGAIMFLGALILYWGEGYVPYYSNKKSGFSDLAWILVIFLLFTLGCLVFSDEFAKLYQPLFGAATFPQLKSSGALVMVFSTNILCVAILVKSTGGSYNNTNWNVTYTYASGGAGCVALEEAVEAIGVIPGWLAIIVILLVVGILLMILFRVLPTMGGRGSAGEVAEI